MIIMGIIVIAKHIITIPTAIIIIICSRSPEVGDGDGDGDGATGVVDTVGRVSSVIPVAKKD